MERRKYKRYSGTPIRVLLKNTDDNLFKYVEVINISIGGVLLHCNNEFKIYDKYTLKIEIPIDKINPFKSNEKDVIFARGIVWRLEADKENYKLDNSPIYAVIRFLEIEEHDKIVISQFLSNFEENVPYE